MAIFDKLRLRPLNSAGISHIFIPLLIIAVVAVGGTFKLVASHADTPCAAGYVTNSSHTGCVLPSSLSSTPQTNSPKKTRAEICAEQYRAGCTGLNNQRNNDAIAKADKAAPAPKTDDPAPVSVPTATLTSKPAVVTAKPEGNITVLTYLKSGSDNVPLGNVKVSISRSGGSEGCNTHPSLKATTNAKKDVVDGNRVVQRLKGTAHFRGCAAGSYTATVVGRKGYDIVGSTSKHKTLDKDNTATFQFVLKKHSSR